MSRAGNRRRRGGDDHGGHGNHERWMVSYADMITLLMVLFIVLFAISQVDQKKFAQLKDGLAAGFGAPPSPLQGNVGPLDNAGTAPEIIRLPQVGASPAPMQPAAGGTPDQTQDRAAQQREADRLREIQERIAKALAEAGLSSSVRMRVDERGLVVSIVTDRVLFPADRAELQPAGHRVLDALSTVLAGLSNDIVVEGHTNQVPVKPKFYPSEWELSVARATAVVRYLIDTRRLPANRMEAAGFADQRPLYPPSDPRAATLNRRVDVVVLSEFAPARNKLPVAAG